jgi:NAD(P)H-flavin reductase
MHRGKGKVIEILLEDGQHLGWIACPPNLIPMPGQYLLASDASDLPLSVPLYYTDSATESFLAALPESVSWHPGRELYLCGPLGRGFEIPVSAQKIALVTFDNSLTRLRGLIKPALKQAAAVVAVSNFAAGNLPDEVEVQPIGELAEVLKWADYVAWDVAHENLLQLKEMLERQKQLPVKSEAQILIRTAIPCGGVADCGVCAVTLKSGWKLACKEGPVFDWNELGF